MRWDEQKLHVFSVGVSTDKDAADEVSNKTEDAKEPSGEAEVFAQRADAPQTGQHSDHPSLDRQIADVSYEPIGRYLSETLGAQFDLTRIDPREYAASKLMLSSPPQQRRDYVRLIVQRMAERPGGSETQQLQVLLSCLLRRKNQWDESTLRPLIDILASYRHRHLWSLPTTGIVRLTESYSARHELTQPFEQSLRNLSRLYKVRASSGDERQIHRRIIKLLSHADSDAPIEFDTAEAWTDVLVNRIEALPQEAKARWKRLLHHASTARAAKPSGQWTQRASDLVREVDGTEFRSVVKLSLQSVGQPGDPARFNSHFDHRTDPTQIHEQYSDLLRGLIWFVAATPSPEMITVLGRCAETCFERLPRQKPRSLKVAIACINGLGEFRSQEALIELNRLLGRARQASVKSRISATISTLSGQLCSQPHELAELSVPDLELAEFGRYRTTIGKYTAEVSIESPGITKSTWRNGDERSTRAVPRAVKSYYSTEWEKLKKRAQEINAEIPTQKLRLERLLVSKAHWDYSDFQRHYADHPLVGPLARCLIWQFSQGSRTAAAIWTEEGWLNGHGDSVEWVGQASQVTPWHPLHAKPEDIHAWQRFIESRGICQPFKQAHREIYRRTSAEGDKDLASDRFAGHYTEVHRLETATLARAWKMENCREFNRTHSPYWDLPEWNVRAIWDTVPNCEQVLERDRLMPNLKAISFLALDTLTPVPLGTVSELVYSEVMREIDCYFLQYASLGNFPVYCSSDSKDHIQEYWLKVAYGPLTAQGEIRKQVLERLLPTSRLAERCQIQGDFLFVQGERNTYHIHLSSGNVQLGDSRQDFHASVIAFSQQHTGLPPGSGFPRLPFGGDVRLASILRLAGQLSRESRIANGWLLARLGDAAE